MRALMGATRHAWETMNDVRAEKEEGNSCEEREVGTERVMRDVPSSLASSQSSFFSFPFSSLSSSSSVRFRGSQVILFSFFSRRRALANHVDTWVSVILVMMASMIFSPLVGYGFFLCSFSHAFRVLVASRVAFLRCAALLKSKPQ